MVEYLIDNFVKSKPNIVESSPCIKNLVNPYIIFWFSCAIFIKKSIKEKKIDM